MTFFFGLLDMDDPFICYENSKQICNSGNYLMYLNECTDLALVVQLTYEVIGKYPNDQILGFG